MTIARGLDGIVVDTTAISQVNPAGTSLVYRGYRVQDLAEQCSFEEVAYLLWYGALPNRAQLAQFQQRERSRRSINDKTLQVIALVPHDAHPMDLVRTGVSYLGTQSPNALQLAAEERDQAAVDLLAKIPTIVAA